MNPILRGLNLRANLNLYKIRTCRNIAGMKRALEIFAAPTDTYTGIPAIGTGGQLVLPGLIRYQPTPYRYQALIERAKQLAQPTMQIEQAFLSNSPMGLKQLPTYSLSLLMPISMCWEYKWVLSVANSNGDYRNRSPNKMPVLVINKFVLPRTKFVSRNRKAASRKCRVIMRRKWSIF